MGDVVNLRQFRKRKDKGDKEATAQTNRASHGRTKAEKAHDAHEQRAETKKLDAHRLPSDPPESD